MFVASKAFHWHEERPFVALLLGCFDDFVIGCFDYFVNRNVLSCLAIQIFFESAMYDFLIHRTHLQPLNLSWKPFVS